jgi:hypothetical protein
MQIAHGDLFVVGFASVEYPPSRIERAEERRYVIVPFAREKRVVPGGPKKPGQSRRVRRNRHLEAGPAVQDWCRIGLKKTASGKKACPRRRANRRCQAAHDSRSREYGPSGDERIEDGSGDAGVTEGANGVCLVVVGDNEQNIVTQGRSGHRIE